MRQPPEVAAAGKPDPPGPVQHHDPSHPAVVIPTWNGAMVLSRCLQALPPDTLAHVIVVDNGSLDGTASMLAERFPDVQTVHLDTNLGFAAAANAGIRAAGGRDVVLLNNDTVPSPQWLGQLLSAVAAASEDVGFVTSKILRLDDGRIDSAGDLLTSGGFAAQRGHNQVDAGQYDEATVVFGGCGGATWFRRAMLDDVGGFDERFFAYLEDVDLCFRAQLRGWHGRFAPRAVVGHEVSATASTVPGFKRYQSARNSWYLLIRCMPAPLLLRALPGFLLKQVGTLVLAVFQGEARAMLAGSAAGLRAIPTLLASRREIQADSRVPAAEVEELLAPAHYHRRVKELLSNMRALRR